jgi:hypothetical protein
MLNYMLRKDCRPTHPLPHAMIDERHPSPLGFQGQKGVPDRLLEIKQELDDIVKQNGDKIKNKGQYNDYRDAGIALSFCKVLAVQALAPVLPGLKGLKMRNLKGSHYRCDEARLLAPA